MEDPVDRTDVLWSKKKDKHTEMLITLDKTLSAIGYRESKDQYDFLMKEGAQLGFEGAFFVHIKTYSRWRVRILAGKDITRNSSNAHAWELISKVLSKLDGSPAEPVQQVVATIRESRISAGSDSDVVWVDDKSFNSAGDLFSGLEHLRRKWGLLLEPENVYIPRRLKDMVDEFCVKCIENAEFANSWACEGSKDVPNIQFTASEIQGEEMYSGHRLVECKNSRKFIGNNISADEAAWHNRYTSVQEDTEKNLILDMVKADVPGEIIPKKDDTKESLLARLAESTFLDLSFNIFSDTPLTSQPGSMQAARRTTGMVTKMPHIHHSELESGTEEGIGRNVIELRTYTNAESPNNLWMCRPMKKKVHVVPKDLKK